MKKEDKGCLMFLAALGSIILASGVGTAALFYRNRHSIKDATVGFVTGSCVAAFAEYLAFSINE